jgi:hypothetical protein
MEGSDSHHSFEFTDWIDYRYCHHGLEGEKFQICHPFRTLFIPWRSDLALLRRTFNKMVPLFEYVNDSGDEG